MKGAPIEMVWLAFGVGIILGVFLGIWIMALLQIHARAKKKEKSS